MSIRKYINNIKALYNNNGELRYDTDHIQHVAVQYFTNLFNGDQGDIAHYDLTQCRMVINE